MIKKLPLYIFLLPAVYLAHNYNQLFGFIPFETIAWFCLWTALLTGIILLISWLLTKSINKAVVVCFCILSFLLFFGPYHDFLKSVFGKNAISSYKVVVPLALLVMLILLRNLLKRPASLAKFTHYANVLLLLLLGVELIFASLKFYNYTQDHNRIYSKTILSDNYKPCNKPDSAKPDIYYIVIDEYTNNKILRERWDFDNSDIENYLAGKGFRNIDDSHANYDFTTYSISSLLNMDYIDTTKAYAPLSTFLVTQGVRSISNNETFNILKKEDYTIRFMSPLHNPIEDIGVLKVFDQYPHKQLYMHTFLGRFEQDIAWNFKLPNLITIPSTYNEIERRAQDVRTTIDKIKSTANDSANRKPQFVFGHLFITHIPHLYDSTGNIRTVDEINLVDPFKSYTDQVRQANKAIKELVDYITTHNRKNTVIVIMGDHGYRNYPTPKREYYFSNFCSIYFPDQNYQPLYNTVTSVNLFRILFNTYFCQQLPLLKDTTIKVKFPADLRQF